MIQQAVWANTVEKDGKSSIKTIPFPWACEACPEYEKKECGCGFEGHEGKATYRYEYGAEEDPWKRTCPRYYWHDHGFQNILADLDDYKLGALGDVNELEYPYLEYLRILKSELAKWEDVQHRKLG